MCHVKALVYVIMGFDLKATFHLGWMLNTMFGSIICAPSYTISNPDFGGEFDYMPLQEYNMDSNHHFENFMSGNWAWKQAVSQNLLFYYTNLTN